jgi:predicted transporter
VELPFPLILVCPTFPLCCCWSFVPIAMPFWLWVGLEGIHHTHVVWIKGCCFAVARSICKTLGHMIQQSSGNSYLSSDTGTRFLFLTGGIVFLTLVVNGSTTQLLLHLLRMDTLTATKVSMLILYSLVLLLFKSKKQRQDIWVDNGTSDHPSLYMHK